MDVDCNSFAQIYAPWMKTQIVFVLVAASQSVFSTVQYSIRSEIVANMLKKDFYELTLNVSP